MKILILLACLFLTACDLPLAALSLAPVAIDGVGDAIGAATKPEPVTGQP